MNQSFTLVSASLLMALTLLAGCTSDSERVALDEVASFYGGNVGYSKGSNITTADDELQGKFLEIKLSNAQLSQRFSNLHIPASNCAYLVYSHLTPIECKNYDYLRVTLSDAGATHSYSFASSELQAASQAASSFTTCMTNLQQQNYLALANNFNPAALDSVPPDSILPIITRVARRIGPVTDYSLEGYSLINAPIAGKTQQFVQLFVSLREPQPRRKLLIVTNPRLQAQDKFLYGVNLLN